MKADTTVVIVKAGCYVVIGGLTPLSSALAQWANTGDWPPRIAWVIVLAGCGVGAATQLLSYLSGSYAEWKKTRSGNNQPTTT